MITVLRLGHRVVRDERTTTHVCLVARAFGADRAIYTGEQDRKMEEAVRKTAERWGGDFSIRYEKKHGPVLKEAKGKGALLVHLTMYGERLQDKIGEISKAAGKEGGEEENAAGSQGGRGGHLGSPAGRKNRGLLIIVGGAKVPSEIYHEADYNIAVTGQPHSEVAALAVFLDHFFQGRELEEEFGGRISVIPSARGKQVREREKSL